jgi:predicted O-linked N-acetylglucosamine transferase (SPINDLY family)
MATVSEALSIALRHRQAGELSAAEQIYRQILTTEPKQPEFAEAYANLGDILFQRGKLADAIDCLHRAAVLKPDWAEIHNNLGAMLQQQGDLASAIASYRSAIECKPNYAVAYFNLANALRDQGNQQEAIQAYASAVALQPDFAEAYANWGNVLADLRQPSEAIACFQQAIRLKPDLAAAYNSLGTVFYEQGQFSNAVACYQQAVELLPGYSEAHSNLGAALKHVGQVEESIAHHRRALELKPDYAEAHCNLGNVYLAQRKFDNAAAAFRRAIELKPDFCVAINNLGNTFLAQAQLDAAIDCYRQALALKPDYAEAHCNLGNAMKDSGRLDAALASFRRAIELQPRFMSAHSNLLYTLYFCPDYDAPAIYKEHDRWNKRHAEPLRQFIQPLANDRSPNRRLRVGYVSPNFRNHCQAFFTIPLLSSHDHNQYEVVCYSDVLWPDAITERLRSYSDLWRDIRTFSDDEVAAQIRDDRIDILIDLTMHMEGRRLLVFARKPAPIQACWLAYPGTTGLATMDYRLTDPFLDPPGLFDHYYTEESVRLPDTFWCYDPLTDQPAVNALPARSNGYVTFGSLNNYCKINRGVLELWARVMRGVPGSRLLLLSPDGSHRQTALDILAQEGVDSSRIAIVAPRPRAQYLELYHQIDIGLDPLPANGHTTSLDAYWMGVPVVTIVGRTAIGRAGVSQLSNLGLQELIGHSPDEFIQIATELAHDVERLAGLRASLRSRMQSSPLMDAPRFARNVESAYRHMWTRWCRG